MGFWFTFKQKKAVRLVYSYIEVAPTVLWSSYWKVHVAIKLLCGARKIFSGLTPAQRYAISQFHLLDLCETRESSSEKRGEE